MSIYHKIQTWYKCQSKLPFVNFLTVPGFDKLKNRLKDHFVITGHLLEATSLLCAFPCFSVVITCVGEFLHAVDNVFFTRVVVQILALIHVQTVYVQRATNVCITVYIC